MLCVTHRTGDQEDIPHVHYTDASVVEFAETSKYNHSGLYINLHSSLAMLDVEDMMYTRHAMRIGNTIVNGKIEYLKLKDYAMVAIINNEALMYGLRRTIHTPPRTLQHDDTTYNTREFGIRFKITKKLSDLDLERLTQALTAETDSLQMIIRSHDHASMIMRCVWCSNDRRPYFDLDMMRQFNNNAPFTIRVVYQANMWNTTILLSIPTTESDDETSSSN